MPGPERSAGCCCHSLGIISARGALPARTPQSTLFRSRMMQGLLSPVGLAPLRAASAPPLCLSRPSKSPSSFVGARGALGAGRGGRPDWRLQLGSPVPVSKATARAGSAAQSRPRARSRLCKRRAARSQTPGRIAARKWEQGRGRLRGLVLGPAFAPAHWTGRQAPGLPGQS